MGGKRAFGHSEANVYSTSEASLSPKTLPLEQSSRTKEATRSATSGLIPSEAARQKFNC